MILKNILFSIHYYSTFFFTFGWIIYPNIIYIQYIVIISWYINNNKCLLSQLDYYMFNETFMGKKEKYIVPIHNRYLLYINNIFATIYIIYRYIPILIFILYVYLYNNKDMNIQNIHKRLYALNYVK